MIAHIIPLTRLPARFTFFDYHIPEGMEVSLGDLVRMPFRGTILSGIVRGIAKNSEQKKLAHIISREQKTILSPKDLKRLETIATLIGQSPTSVCAATLPKYLAQSKVQKIFARQTHPIAISQEDIGQVKIFLQEIDQKPAYCTLQGDQETGIVLAQALAKRLKDQEQLLILVPRDRDAEFLYSVLKHPHLATVTGTTKENERSAAFLAWHQGTMQVLVGTKQVALWNPQALAYVLVLQAGNDEYATMRRNPKFDPREAARLLAQDHHASYISIDTLPRIEDTAFSSPFLPSIPTSPSVIPTFPREIPFPPPLFIPLSSSTEKTPSPLITHSLLEHIKTASQSGKKVLLFLNRKGTAKRLQCIACKQVPLCGTCGNLPTVRTEDLLCDRCGTEMWIPKQCPLCGKPKLKLVGVGGDKVVADLQKYFPEKKVGFVEKKNDAAWKTADIIVGTEHIFANLLVPFTRYGFALIADLMADLPTGGIDFRASEHTARQLLRLLALAKREKATCLIQTWLPERLPDLIASDYVIQEELRIRQTYSLPPFGAIYSTPNGPIRLPLSPPSPLSPLPPAPTPPFTLDSPYVPPPRPPRT